MVADILIAALLVIVAVVLGLTVHPLFWFVLILVVLVLVARPTSRW